MMGIAIDAVGILIQIVVISHMGTYMQSAGQKNLFWGLVAVLLLGRYIERFGMIMIREGL